MSPSLCENDRFNSYFETQRPNDLSLEIQLSLKVLGHEVLPMSSVGDGGLEGFRESLNVTIFFLIYSIQSCRISQPVRTLTVWA